MENEASNSDQQSADNKRSSDSPGDSASSEPSAQHSSAVPAADVCRTAAAPYAADSSSATASAAPEQRSAPEPGSSTAGRIGGQQSDPYRDPAESVPGDNDEPDQLPPDHPAPPDCQLHPGSGIWNSQQAVLLGNASSPALSASQAQMYLRAQMLIFTPAATVSSIQSDVSSASSSSQPVSTQVQNLTVRGTVGETTQLPTLAMKPAALSLHHVTKPAGYVGSHMAESHKKGEPPGTDSQTPTGRTTHAIIAPAYSPQLVSEPKPVLHQIVLQKSPSLQPRPVLPLTQPLTHQPQVSQGLSSPPITSQAPLVPPSSYVESNKQKANPIPPSSFGGQDGAVQCRLLPPSSAVIFQIPNTRTATPPLQDNLRKHCESHRTQPQSSVQIPPTTPTNRTTDNHQATPHDPGQNIQAKLISSPPLDMTSGNGSAPLPAA
ncbi:unnamed protein product, partial [Staurois parvus]